ncbi:hypothetical protein WMF37_18495 [Sorangium sp. So ce291]|uniref:hypothetical protein n=1 Tax=Sorangium sp. So ce291 TaxID=3133294 RepID=UPI003F5E1158
MGKGLTEDESAVLAALPKDGAGRGNKALREAVGLSAKRFEAARLALIAKGYAQPWRGPGGSLRRVVGDEHQLLAEIPSDGRAIGNTSLRNALGWTWDKYWDVRDRLIDQGLIEKGRGKGGSVRRVAELDDDDAGEAPDAEYERETHLYEPIQKVLQGDWARDERLSRFVVEITAQQGRRRTGGKWTRPDLAVLSEKHYPVTNQTVFDVTTFEVKLGGYWDITAVYEAASHSQQANYAYVFFQHSVELIDRDHDLLERCSREARRLGVGVIVSKKPSDYEEWEFLVEAVRQLPDPALVENFVALQISPEGHAELSRWWHGR